MLCLAHIFEKVLSILHNTPLKHCFCEIDLLLHPRPQTLHQNLNATLLPGAAPLWAGCQIPAAPLIAVQRAL